MAVALTFVLKKLFLKETNKQKLHTSIVTFGGDVCNFNQMNKTLLSLKSKLKQQFVEEEDIYKNYIGTVFEWYNDVWDISDAFSFYNQDKRILINLAKKERKTVKAKYLHIASQFFTPKWLVQYIVDNSLGRFISTIKTDFLDGETNHQPKCLEAIKIFDPAIGTGNMLLYAYDLLEKAYIERGDATERIPHLILSSFYGLDIDSRMVEVAKRLLLKRANLKSFDFNIYSFSAFYEELEKISIQKRLTKLCECIHTLRSDKGIGSMLKTYEGMDLDLLLLKNEITEKSKDAFSILTMLSQQYDVILVNPPYLSSSDYNQELKEYLYTNYPLFKQDLFSVFIVRCLELLKKDGLVGIVCPYNWMFIKSFEKLREYITKEKGIVNLMQLCANGYSKAVVYLSAFVLSNVLCDKGYYIRLTEFKGKEQEKKARQAINNCVPYRYIIKQELFDRTPHNAIIYWTGQQFLDNFAEKKLSEYVDIRQGMATGDNKRFLRKVVDINQKEIAFDAESIEDFDKKDKKYALYNKGGKFRKWYGNIDYVIAFDSENRKILEKQGNRMPSKKYYFKECITWTLVSSKGHFGARYSKNSVFDVGGSCGFIKDNSPTNIYVVLGYLCSKVATYYLNALNPTLNVQVGDIKNLPFILPNEDKSREIEKIVKENIVISKRDWYNKGKIGDFVKIRKNEEKLNTIFLELYKLQGELDCSVNTKLITLEELK